MQRSNVITLNDILQACLTIQRLLSGFNEDDFYADERTQYAIIHQLLVIGEAANRLSREF